MKTTYFIMYRFVIVITTFSLIFFSCKEEKKDGPEMKLNNTTLAFTSSENEGYFVITNTGDETLEWEIANKPIWIDLSNLEGNLAPGSEIVEVTADISTELGSYEDVIEITSNGGKGSVNVTFEHNVPFEDDVPIVGIYPGSGVDDMKLWSTYLALKAEYGEPEEKVTILGKDDGINPVINYLVADYGSLGLAFYFASETTVLVDEDSLMFLIEIDKPYANKTSKNISMNNTIMDVEDAYGEPNGNPEPISIDSEGGYGIYWYDPLGIAFIYDLADDQLLAIWIYERQPVKSASSILKKIPFHTR